MRGGRMINQRKARDSKGAVYMRDVGIAKKKEP
jgi:hypothetical protein